ncbi:DUF2071 domain-containing protein [Blastopirellula retiformator]|uniref:Acetoacetate decarboxylase (ADC) n=1 Tax=Blastopirellula retiformator TaxID=2527970 RepID=A0A5C5UWZ9_9BACT|nr:DUF2071 domain-containing protein [Blastopirellula retiformator]TWT30904.1 hypothetical protein Enr8_44300 [Blastopirellula retiformator]
MQIPTIQGTIDRRILVNYRVAPDTLAKALPPPFRPQLVNGFGMAGICLIRLKNVTPKFLPSFCGISSENAAHRFAVEWDQAGQTSQGVYIPRRDTSSWLNALVGGRLFPGVHHLAQFDVNERDDSYSLDVHSDDHQIQIAVQGAIAAELPRNSVFSSLQEASNFFEAGCLGYSDGTKPNEFDGLELRSFGWKVQPLRIERVESSYFDDRRLFPGGTIEFDSALLMKGIRHEWIGKESLSAS